MKQLTSPFDLIKKAINIFSKKENAIFLAEIYLPILPLSIISRVQGYIPTSLIDSNAMWFNLVFGVLQILYLLIGVFVMIAGIVALGKVVGGGELSVKKTFGSSWKYYWIFLLLSIVLVLIYFFGFILLIIPGLLFVVWFAFSRFMMIEKDLGVKQALAKSKELAKGIYWKILGRLIIFGVFTVIVQMILSVIPYGLGSIISSLLGAFYMLPLYLLYRELSA
jgi:hypothetical protein